MRKRLSPTTVETRMEDFLKSNPSIRKALKVFEIARDQYESALNSDVSFYTSASTQPRNQYMASGKAK